jgi:hypothetical protein
LTGSWHSAFGDIVIETLSDGTMLVNGDPVNTKTRQSPTAQDDEQPAE